MLPPLRALLILLILQLVRSLRQHTKVCLEPGALLPRVSTVLCRLSEECQDDTIRDLDLCLCLYTNVLDVAGLGLGGDLKEIMHGAEGLPAIAGGLATTASITAGETVSVFLTVGFGCACIMFSFCVCFEGDMTGELLGTVLNRGNQAGKPQELWQQTFSVCLLLLFSFLVSTISLFGVLGSSLLLLLDLN